MARSKSIKKLIAGLEPDELREVIVELSKLNPKNKQFLQLFLQSSDSADIDSIIHEAKKKIYGHLYGRAMFPKIDLAQARKTVNEYSKVFKEYPSRVAELKLYYVEVGTEITNDFGDMNESFYSSMESMFESFCKLLMNHPNYFDQFEDRISELESVSRNIGWGYGEVIGNLAIELEMSIKSD